MFAAQANIVTNPGFDTGSFSGWTSSFWDVSSFAPQAGDFSAITLCGGANCLDPSSPDAAFLFQDLPTTPGAIYTLSFWFNSGVTPDEGSGLRVLWGDSVVAEYMNVDTGNQYQMAVIPDLIATSASTRLEFLARQDPDVFYLDTISVDSSGVPEPATFLLVLIAVPILARRRCTM